MLYVMTPGSQELTSDVAHWLQNGHTAHAATHAERHSPDPEHGCSGPFHVCSCHQASTFLPLAPRVALAPPALVSPRALAQTAEPFSTGHLHGFFRPPIA